MNGNLEHIDALIAKVLTGEADTGEKAMLDAWGRESQEQAHYIEDTRKLFATIDGFIMEAEVDVNGAWNKLDSRLPAQEAKEISLFRRIPALRIAASVALLITLGFVANWLFTDTVIEPVMLSAVQAPVEQKLPDGSKVFMNKNAEITYAVNKDKVREVKLKGEAFFEVVHNEEQPFVITVDDIVIKDIGTAFNVKALPGSDVVEVVVESGEVQFYTSSNKGLNLVKGEKATYDKVSKRFTKMIPGPSENTTSYKSKVFNFEESSLEEVLMQINAVYGSDIRLANDSLAACRLSVTFNNENIEVVVSVIAETLDLAQERKGATIILRGEPCNK